MYRSLLLYLAVLFSVQAFAIQNNFEYITVENGLSQGNIECIFQDSQGFMWFGTFNGLNRYDGYKITIFNFESDNPNSLSHEHVVQMCEDTEGKIWIATFGGGISVFDPKTWDFKRLQYTIIDGDTLPFRNTGAIATDLDGNIWFVEENTGVFVYNTKMEKVNYFMPGREGNQRLPQSYYFGVVIDQEGTAWLGIGNGTLGRITRNSEKVDIFRFEERTASADDGIKSMYVDRTGKIWIGTTSQGAYVFDPADKYFINYRKEDSTHFINGNTVMAFAEDTEGNILIGIDGGGINVINPDKRSYSSIMYDMGNMKSINTNAVYALFYDLSDNLWVGTYSGGINFQSKYKTKFKNFTPDPLNKNSLSYKNVTAIMQDRDGEMWIGTDGGGLNKFDIQTESFTHYRADPTNPNWLQTDVIIHLMQDRDGDIYISSYNHGLTIFNKYDETFKQYLPNENDPTSIAGIHPWFTFQDSYGIVWVGMLAVGLDQFDKETQTFRHYTSDVDDPTTLNSPNIKVIYEDMNLDLWIGTEGGGLHKYNRDEDNFTRYSTNANNPKSLSNDDVRAIYEDLTGRFWVGTSLGLDLMQRDSGTFKTLTVEDGLSGNTIDGILEDELGFLWISTDGGLTKFHPDSMTFKNYDKTDGLQGNEFNYTASTVSNNGYFFFGGKNGFNMFFPRDIMDNPHAPPVVLTEIQIMNKPYQVLESKRRGKKVKQSLTTIKSLKFTHKQNIITFEFAALDYGNSAKNQYKYILEGFDKEWYTTSAAKRFATYTNLRGGDYVFRVIASNGDGVWNNEGLSIDITITPPFWKRKWFILLVIAVVLWLVVRYIRNRESKLQEDKARLEQKIQEGLAEVNKQKAEMEKKDLELQKKIESEKEQNWLNVGMGRMSEVMSRNKDDLFKLSQSIISEMVEYVKVSQGAIYLLNDDDEDDTYLELMAAYAPDDNHIRGTRVETGEGQIGASFQEGRVIKVDNLPPDYAKFTSGLGEVSLTHLAVIPLKLNEIVIGVVELLSLSELPDYMINFIEKSGETLTSILTALKANEKTKKLFEQQKMQAEELAAQEEELRQNLEEMQATQEELARMKEAERVAEEERKAAEKEFMDQLQKQNEELKTQQEALKKEEYLFNTLLNNVKEHIYFKDVKSRFIRLSASMKKLFKAKTLDEILGKSDFDFFDKEHAQPAYDDEQNIIKTGKPILDKLEREVHKDGSVSWVNTSKMPLIDQDGNIVGTFGISTDVSEIKNMEIEIKQRNEELMAQEEELRQNLEEMQTTQEELLRLKEINEEKQAALEKEEYLFNALLNNVNESIYFKDEKSRFIRVSKSMLKLFKLKSFKDLIGKTDFDFFDEEHARPAFEDEQRIIKTGTPIIDLVEKEVHKDGSFGWVSSSKMPLKDKKGNIVGTFGISKDITNVKQLEMDTQRTNEKLEVEKIMFAALMDNIAARITYKDTEARHIRINKTKARGLGLKDPSEIYGKTDPEVFGSTHSAKRLREEIDQIKKGVSSLNIEELYILKDGSEHWGDTSRIPLKNKQGEIIGGLVITWDITDKKNLQSELEQANNLLKSISHDLPVIIFNTGTKGDIHEIKGEGLKLMNFKDPKTAAGKLFSLIPEIKKSITAKDPKDSYAFSGKVALDKKAFKYKCLLLHNKSTTGGFSGYVLFEGT